jgi:hypothetical protein
MTANFSIKYISVKMLWTFQLLTENDTESFVQRSAEEKMEKILILAE